MADTLTARAGLRWLSARFKPKHIFDSPLLAILAYTSSQAAVINKREMDKHT